MTICMFIVATMIMGDCCASSVQETAKFPSKPYNLFWCPNPQDLRNATFITPQFWIEGDKQGQKNYPEFSQDFWLERGVMPLKWAGGYCYKEKSEDEFAEYWSSPIDRGYKGIAIDEFGSGKEEIDTKMAKALVRAKKAAPELFIAAWNAGPLTDVLAEGYRDGADLVILEIYVGGTEGLEKYFAKKIEKARETGIIGKTIIALGVNDKAKKEDLERWKPWANTKEELQAQVRWIRKNAPEMPGIAFYASHASDELVIFADELCRLYYPR